MKTVVMNLMLLVMFAVSIAFGQNDGTVGGAAAVAAPTTNVQQQSNVQPIYIVQPPTSGGVQVQPTTTVEANSQGDQLRRQREDLERQTEDRIQQRIEAERIQAEKERMERLLGPGVTVQQQQQQTVVVPASTPAQTVVVTAPSTVVVENKSDSSRVFRIGGNLGIGSYPSVDNVNAIYAAGAVADVTFDTKFSLEGAFTFSSYDINNAVPCSYCMPLPPPMTTMNQFNFTVSGLYRFSTHTVTPMIGLGLGYTRRSYSQRLGYTGMQSSPNTTIAGSNAYDVGAIGGVDIKLSDKITMGASLRYFWNLSYRTDDAMAYGYAGPQMGSPVESLNYYFALLNVMFTL